jgi:hypothetical protein
MKRHGQVRALLLRGCAAMALLAAAAGCDPGMYYKGFLAGCTNCVAGQHSPGGTGNRPTECAACAPGYKSTEKATTCTECGEGRHANAQHTLCAACAAGQFSASGAQLCSGCAAGRQSNDAHTGCTDCSAGRSAGPSSTCVACGPGTHSNAAHTSCPSCGSGHYSAGATSSCAECTAGRFSDGTGAATCRACQAGKYASSGAGSCSNCEGGQYSAAAAATGCIKCAAGKFSPEGTPASRCTDCHVGHYSSSVGASSCDACPADSSSVSGSDTVQACHCSAGYYGRIVTTTSSCKACDRGRFKGDSTPGATCSDCELGQYQDHTGQPSCVSCGALDGCHCQGASKSWPTGPGGICRQGLACLGASSCRAGATCTAEGVAHTCDCNSEDVFGPTCERSCVEQPDPDDPNQAWCGNLGSCKYDPDATGVNKGYSCKCKQGYSGPNCLKVDPCIVHAPCRNGGICDNVTAEPRGYECHCPTGFAGVNCSTLLTAWDTNSDDAAVHKEHTKQIHWLVLVGALAATVYFGVYWFMLQSLDGGNGQAQTARVTGILLIILIGTCVGFAVAATVHNQPCEATDQPVNPTFHPPAPSPQPYPPAPSSCNESQGAHGSWNGTVCVCDPGYTGTGCTFHNGRQCCNTCCPPDKFTPHATSGGATCYCWNPEPGVSKTCDPGCDATADPDALADLIAEPATLAPLPEPNSKLALAVVQTVQSSSPTAAMGDFETCGEFVKSHTFRTNAFAIYGVAAAVAVVQSVVAFKFHTQIDHWFPTFATAGASRLLRGAGLALVSLVVAAPGITAGILMNPNRLDPARVDTLADELVIYGWHPIVFGVLVPCLPVGVALSRVYRKEQLRDRGNCTAFLMECGVPKPELFLRAERSFASVSGLLLPFFWNSHLVNEQQELLSFASADRSQGPSDEVRYARANREFASVDGVRSLSPVVCSLNFLAAGWVSYMISALPASLVWTPSLFFGAAWLLVAAVMMVVLSVMLIMSLSEHRRDAAERNKEIIWGWGQHCKHGSLRHQCDEGAGYCHESIIDTERMPTKCERLQEYFYCIKTYVTSWTGQTVISGFNHLLAIGFFSYGLHEFSEHLTLELKKFLVSGLVLTGVGVVTSATSFFQRRWPQYKFTPTDDSFRLACVLKALLVMNKALIVYELSKIDMRMLPHLQTWTLWVTAVCVLSVFILALLTYAFDAFKIYARPELVENAGIPDGKKFVKMYSLSFVCCKLATAFFVVLGHIPELAGCGEQVQSFKGTRQMLLNRDGSSTIECGVCLPNNRNNETHCEDHASSTYYSCNTTCAKLFFSGGGELPISLDVFVLVPILWLPFMVYSNNEVARVIDGIWERRRIAMNTHSGRPGLHTAARVGLSTTGHGYSSIANLAHAVFLLCGVVHIYFLVAIFVSTGHFGYSVDAPLANLLDQHGSSVTVGGVPQDLGSVLQEPLDEAGRYVTWSVIVLNLLTLCRFLYEKLAWCSSDERNAAGGSPLQQRLLLQGGEVPANNPANRSSDRSLCMYHCGHLPTPGHDTCCRACFAAKGELLPEQHDVACRTRERARQGQPLGSE